MKQRFKLMIPTVVPRLSLEDGREIGTEKGPPVEMEFELDIDLDQIKKRLGSTAAFAKTKRSQEMSGLIVVKRVK